MFANYYKDLNDIFSSIVYVFKFLRVMWIRMTITQIGSWTVVVKDIYTTIMKRQSRSHLILERIQMSFAIGWNYSTMNGRLFILYLSWTIHCDRSRNMREKSWNWSMKKETTIHSTKMIWMILNCPTSQPIASFHFILNVWITHGLISPLKQVVFHPSSLWSSISSLNRSFL